MTKLIAALFALGLFFSSSLLAQPDSDEKLKALEKNLSAEQKRLFRDYIDFRVRYEFRHFDPSRGAPLRSESKIIEEIIDNFALVPAEQAKAWWRNLPKTLKRSLRELDPSHVSAEERKAAERLPAAAKEQVAKLLSEQIDEVIAARRHVLAYGPACRALVADQLSKLAANSPKRLRHDDLLARLEFEEASETRIRIIEPALHKLSQLEKARKKANSVIAVLAASGICDQGNRSDPYGELCFYNFLHHNHEYHHGAGLRLMDGNNLDTNFFGGQDNRLTSLGEVKYAEVKTAPGPETTAKWWKRWNNVPPPTAVVGHVYLLHLLEAQGKVDFTVKFQVLEMSPDQWIIIEWERIPQDK